MVELLLTVTLLLMALLFVPSLLPHLPDLLAQAGKPPRWIDDHRDKAAYVLHLIVFLPHFQHCPAGFVNLGHRHLTPVLGARYVSPVLAVLLDAGAIETDSLVFRGKKSLGYRITAAYQSPAVGIDIFKETFQTTLERYREKTRTIHTRGSLLANIELDLKKLRVHFEAARQCSSSELESSLRFVRRHASALNTSKLHRHSYQQLLDLAAAADVRLMPLRDVRASLQSQRRQGTAPATISQILLRNATDRHNCNMFALMQLHERAVEAPTRPVPGSRVYSILTNLSSGMRQFLFHARHAGSGLCNIDIRNSQPFFLSLLLLEHFRNRTLPADVAHYIALTSSGTFYEHVAAGMGQPLPEKQPGDTSMVLMRKARARAEFKGSFFSSLFFCQNSHTQNSRAGRYFRANFPAVANFLQEQKRGAYQQLAINLQFAEAQVMIERVSKSLHRAGIWHAGLHDSVICLPQHADQVLQLIQHTFQRYYGLTPTLSIERIAG